MVCSSIGGQLISVLILSILPAIAHAQTANPSTTPTKSDDTVQLSEFLVTGSHFKQTTYEDVGSPVSVLSAADLLKDGALPSPAMYMRDLPQAVGLWSDGVNGDNQFGSGALNLRGLGSNASLVLINGYRQTRNSNALGGDVDINTMPPNIMLGRVETLLDGASSLYGADAVGGVANFITRDDFVGIETRSEYRTITNYRAKYGHEFTQGILVGGQVGEKLHVVAAYEYFKQTQMPFGGTGHTMEVQGTPSQFGNAITYPGNFQVPKRDASGKLTGARTLTADPDCLKIQQQNITTNPKVPGWGSDIYMYNGQCYGQYSFYGVLNDLNRWNTRVAMTWKPSDRVTIKAAFAATSTTSVVSKPPSSAVPGGYVVPGTNPGNPFRAVNSLGQPLFAVPNPANPAVPLLDASGNAVLTSDPTNPASGIAFNENILIASWRPLSTTNAPVSREEYKGPTIRGEVGAEGQINTDWSWNVHYTQAVSDKYFPITDVFRDKVIAGLNGQLTVGSKTNLWLNPFGNAMLVQPGDPKYNPPEVLEALEYRARTERYSTSLQSWDAVVTGALGHLPAGAINVAVGGQARKETMGQVYDPVRRAGLLLTAPSGSADFFGASHTYASFVETGVPIFNAGERKLELSASARYEKDEVTHSFNPKGSLVYKHNSWVRFNASYGTSFLAPSLFQRYGERTAQTEVFVDPLTGRHMFFTGIFGGTPGLDPQKSKATNVGVTFTLLDRRLNVSANAWRFDFTGLITSRTPDQTAQGVLDGSVPSSAVVRDPISQDITLMRIPYYNAQSRTSDGIDLDFKYNFRPNSLGHFTVNGETTFVNSYDLVLGPGAAAVHGVGNADTGLPMPKWKATAGVSWARNLHSASLIAHYTGQVNLTAAQAAQATPGISDPVARERVTLNAQYRYDFEKVVRGLKATIGVINLANKAPNVPATQLYGFIFGLNDPLPRRAYVSLEWSL